MLFVVLISPGSNDADPFKANALTEAMEQCDILILICKKSLTGNGGILVCH